jgi:cell wall-associated NlpC family hydrolase
VHLAPIEAVEDDPVAVAERFLGVPYLWGGRTSLGLDCSALVQLSFAAAGIAAPRDSDMQEKALGWAADAGNDLAGLRRGDLVFWTGHVAIARGDGTLVHANAHAMAVTIEPVAGALVRIRARGSEVTSVRRVGRSGPMGAPGRPPTPGTANPVAST